MTSPLLSIDPAASHELTGRLLDSEYMLEVFQRELPAMTSETIRVARCKAKPVRSNEATRQGRLHVLFKVWLEAGRRALSKFLLLGVAPVAPGYLDPALDERSRAIRDHPGVQPFFRHSTYVEDLRLALLLFPLDPVLPGLAEVTGAGGRQLLASFLSASAAGAEVEGVECELRHYKPMERAVLRVRSTLPRARDGAASKTVYVKLFADDRGAASFSVLSSLWAATRESRCLRLPEPLGYDANRRMLVLGEVPGQRDLRTWIKRLARGQPLPGGVDLERVKACLSVAARTLQDLQRSDLRSGEQRPFQGELAKLRKRCALVPADQRETRPELWGRFAALLRRMESLAPVNERLVPSHGSYRHKQMVGDEHSLALVDWDGLCLADPALDAATFLGQLFRPGGAPELKDLAAGFRHEILELQPEVGAHLALYEGLALTKRVLSAFEGSLRGKEDTADTGNIARAAEERLVLFASSSSRTVSRC